MSSMQVTTFTAHLPKVQGKSQHTDTDGEYATGSQRNEKVRKGLRALQAARHEVSAHIPWQRYPASSPKVSFEIIALKVLYSCEMSELQVGFPLKFISLHRGWMGDRTSVTVLHVTSRKTWAPPRALDSESVTTLLKSNVNRDNKMES